MKPASKLCLIATSLLMLGTGTALAGTVASVNANNVVLVHGSWADGSSWSEVITRLQAAGLHVTAVQNPLTSVADDVAATKRVLDQQDGPTVLVGHSYAGTVVSDAGVDPKVSALVYVAARAPDANEDFVALSAQYPSMPVRSGVEDHDGYLTLSQDAFLKYFAADVPQAKALALYAVQQPITKTLFSGRTVNAAWHTKPSWYAVSANDQTINPDLERFLAKRMNATTIELPSSHLSLVSHAKEITDLILEASGRPPEALH
ncbi:alpha/beta fold hydrolase [Pseudomonas marginalis]|uniref:alpha/beta fold hydrolase n=1 Tax=Pseudomonas marginalis TaxID=298 RepID=UPI0005FC19FD|nr:alpha/beta hydrolase [Pseudomonas marginalis]KJZ53911.1 hydrolase [Pseudomonas marginalis]KJZ58555.1 hydrolase [Pseudomonas marginalis]